MADQTAIDVYERGNYSEDHREHRDGDPDAPKGSPIDHHDATLTESVGRAAPAALLAGGPWPVYLGAELECQRPRAGRIWHTVPVFVL